MTYLSYALAAAAVAHVLLILFTHWTVGVKAAVNCRRARSLDEATMIQVIPDAFSGKAEIVPLHFRLLVRACTAVLHTAWTAAKN